MNKLTLAALMLTANISANELFFSQGNKFYDYGIESAVNKSPFELIHHPEDLHPHFAATFKPLTTLLKTNPDDLASNDHLLDSLLITPRKEYHHLMYDEAMGLMNTIATEFPQLVKLESIGKTYDDRDIWMMKIDGTRILSPSTGLDGQPEKKAILLTGAHHSRELVSTQMPLYAALDLLHGFVHGNQEKMALLARNQYFFIPMVNTDGCHEIMKHWKETGEMLLKRKNNDTRFEKSTDNCPLMEKGVDINRNYGYIFGNDSGPCSESFPGPHAFSEPETRAMRNMLYKYQDTIKFVYNFHAYGPMYIWPYNGENNNELAQSNPVAQKVFNEIWDEGKFPSSTLRGNAIKTVGYLANGEANDYIMKAFNIPSVSPELANDNFFSGSFFLPYNFVVREVLRDNMPWINTTFKKLGGEVKIDKLAVNEDKFYWDMTNIGLQDWNMNNEGLTVEVQSSQVPELNQTIQMPNFTVRQSKRFQIQMSQAYTNFEAKVIYKKYGSDQALTETKFTVGHVPTMPQFNHNTLNLF